MTSMRIEAENMTLAGGYQIESGSFASGGKYIGLSATLGTTGTASRSLQDSFALPSGIYNVTVAYFDETDGQSPLSLSIAGVEKASWIANQSLVGTRAAATNLTTKTIENVQVNSGDEVKLAGSIHSGENARFDFIEFVPVTPPNTDTTAPTASSFTPSDNATGVAVDANLVVNFSENIKKGNSGNIVIKKLSDNSVVESIDVTASNISVSGSQLTINPTANLASNTDYYVEIANAAIEDMAGNDYAGITGNSAWNFTTVNTTTPPTEVTIEAESMTLTAYKVEFGTFASNGAYIGLSSSTGTATKTFDGVSGSYDVTVGYFDENDGVSDFSLGIGGNTIKSWKGDKSPGDGRATARNLLTQTISGVNLVNGDEIKLSGVLNVGENARFDYVKFVPVSSPPTDTTAPTASSFTPSDNTTGVAVDANLVVNFSENIKKGSSGNIVIKKLSDNSVVESIDVTASNISVSGSQLTINPTANLASNTDYYVEIANGAIEDMAGNDYVGITGNSAWNFTTLGDTTAPTASSFTPSDNATGVSVGANLVVNFNENIKKGSSGNIVIKKLSDNSVVESIDVTASNISVSGSQLTINPTADLASNTDYYVEIANGAIEDIAGNDYAGITGNTAWNFKTADTTNPLTVVTIEAENMTLTGGYRIESGSFASGGQYIGLSSTLGTTGTATTEDFLGESGAYDIVVSYFDESDGRSPLSLGVQGNTVGSWIANQNLGSSNASAQTLTEIVLKNVQVNQNDKIELNGAINSGESARIDRIKFVPAGDNMAPTPTLTADNLTVTSGNTQPYTFTVQYSDNVGVDLATIDSQDLRVTGPNGFNQQPTLVSVNASSDGKNATATYRFYSPGDTWNLSEAGTYTVSMQSNQVLDQIKNPVASGTLGTFNISVNSNGDTANYSQAAKGVKVNLQQEVGYISDFNQAIKIMPLGDSITEGKENNSQAEADWIGYRLELWNQFQSLGVPIDFVGSQSNGTANLPDKNNEGHAGWTINNIRNGRSTVPGSGVNNWLPASTPNVVLLMIGTNDAGGSVSTMKTGLDGLIKTITANSSFNNGDLLVSTIPPIHPQSSFYNSRMQNVIEYNKSIPGIVAAQPVSENVKFVNMWEGANQILETDMSAPPSDNGLHPNANGYKKMANYWFSSILDATGQKDILTDKNKVIGSAYDDVIAGNTSNNTLEGGTGDDQMTGGEGADTFVYNHPNQGQDILTDFNPSFGDQFSISAAGFGAGLVAGTALSTTASDTGVFVSGDTLNYLGNMAHFFYNTATGILGFDPDGNNAQPLTSLATLTNKPVLTANQFTIV